MICWPNFSRLRSRSCVDLMGLNTLTCKLRLATHLRSQSSRARSLFTGRYPKPRATKAAEIARPLRCSVCSPCDSRAGEEEMLRTVRETRHRTNERSEWSLPQDQCVLRSEKEITAHILAAICSSRQSTGRIVPCNRSGQNRDCCHSRIPRLDHKRLLPI